LDFSRCDLVLDLVENVFQGLSGFHDIHDRDVFFRLQFVGEIFKMFGNGGDEVFDGVLDGWFEDIIDKVIKDVVAGNAVLEFANFGNDGCQEVCQKSFTTFNSCFSFDNDILDSSINFLQNCLDNWGGSGNFSFNGSLDFFQKVDNVILDFSRCDLVLDLVENVFQGLSGFHDIHDRDVFFRLQFVGEIFKMFGNGGDEVFDGVLDGWFEDIIEKVIKDIVASKVVFEFTYFGNDGCQEVCQKTFSRFNMSFCFGNNSLDSGINFL